MHILLLYDRRILPILSGMSCRSRPAVFAVQTRQRSAALDGQVQAVEVRFAEATLLDLEHSVGLQLLEVGPDAAFACPHVLGKPRLAGSTAAIENGDTGGG